MCNVSAVIPGKYQKKDCSKLWSMNLIYPIRTGQEWDLPRQVKKHLCKEAQLQEGNFCKKVAIT